MDRPSFDLDITLSAASYFVSLAGGELGSYRMVKYLYLLDRAALVRWGYPVTNDDYDAMENGNVPSRVHDLVAGDVHEDRWSEYFSRDADLVKLEKSDPDFEFLSEAEMGLVKEIHEDYVEKSDDEIREFCHVLPERKDPGGEQRVKIRFEEIMEKIISDPEQRKLIIDDLEFAGYQEQLFQEYSTSG